ncbi:hypothetical protein ACTHQ1_10985 [Janibacter anophelis]|uniref:hypothetical protein n=1 Tax=Janibacter anophelis TaxID=319054 RepID=UPI003F7D2B73
MTDTARQPISRRTVAKGAAWTAPVILGGVTAPALAASPPPVFPVLNVSGTCKHSNLPPNAQRYHIGVTWNNTLQCETTVTVTSISVFPNSGTGVNFTALPDSFDVGAGETDNRHYDSNPTPNMANGTVRILYTFTDCDGNTVDGNVPLTVDTLNPCQSGIYQDWPHPGN